MGFINDIIQEFKSTTTLNETLTIEETFDKTCKNIMSLSDKMDVIPHTNVETVQFFLQLENDLHKEREIIFKRCCEEKGIENSNRAFCIYRDFLAEYNDVIKRYNNILCDLFGGEVCNITHEIFALQDKLLPINNTNIEQHAIYHKHNEKYYKEIEQLEIKRRNLLKDMK